MFGNFYISFFFKFPKLKILETSIFRNFFSEPSYMVNISKFCKKEILIQPPGEPREQHLGDVRPKKFELHKIS